MTKHRRPRIRLDSPAGVVRTGGAALLIAVLLLYGLAGGRSAQSASCAGTASCSAARELFSADTPGQTIGPITCPEGEELVTEDNPNAEGNINICVPNATPPPTPPPTPSPSPAPVAPPNLPPIPPPTPSPTPAPPPTTGSPQPICSSPLQTLALGCNIFDPFLPPAGPVPGPNIPTSSGGLPPVVVIPGGLGNRNGLPPLASAPVVPPGLTVQPSPQPCPALADCGGYFSRPAAPQQAPSATSQPPATVTISTGNPVTVTIRANQYLDLTHSVVISLPPGVTATGAQVPVGTVTIVGGAVIWNGFVLEAGDEASATIDLTQTSGNTIVGVGTPAIQGVTITAIDQGGTPITFQAQGGGPSTDQLPIACSGTTGQTAPNCSGGVNDPRPEFTPELSLPRRSL